MGGFSRERRGTGHAQFAPLGGTEDEVSALADPTRERGAQRYLILVTATPHSGNKETFRSFLTLLNKRFAELGAIRKAIGAGDDVSRFARPLHRTRDVLEGHALPISNREEASPTSRDLRIAADAEG